MLKHLFELMTHKELQLQGTLGVKLGASPNPIKSGQDTGYKVTFVQKGTDTVQVHIDYD